MPDSPSSPVHLADAVAYQEGAVVSRVLFKTPRATITVFAFDAGEGLTEHTTPAEAFVVCVEGEATITIAGRANTVRAGDYLHLPASVPHAVQAATRFRMLLVMIRE